jgi:hypothetical protein
MLGARLLCAAARETMAGSPDRVLGLSVADPEMERASLCGAKPARLDAGADLAMVGAAGLLCARH